MFIVGMSLVFSFRRHKEQETSQAGLFKTILRRTVILFALGLFLNGFPYYHLSMIRIPGVLQRIALGYFFGSLLFLWTSTRVQVVVAVTILVGYWLLMMHVPVPGFGMGDLSKEGNLAAYIDRWMFHGHMYRPVYDPEGFLSTFPSIVSVLAGIWTVLYALKDSPAATLRRLCVLGVLCLALGIGWNFIFPINKALWTSSFVLVTTGLALLCFALLYEGVDVRGWKNWGKPFEALGQNAIAAYVLHIVFLKIQNLIHIPRPDGSPGNLRFYITDHLFAPRLSSESASLAYASVYTVFWIVVFRALARRKIILKSRPLGLDGLGPKVDFVIFLQRLRNSHPVYFS